MTRYADKDEPVAALVTINFDTGETFHEIFRGDDPILKAERFRRSVEGDWPEHDHHIIANKAAGVAAGDRRMKEWFGIEPEKAR